MLQLLLVTLQVYRGKLDGPSFQNAIVHEVISVPNSTRILLNHAVHEATLITKNEADLNSLEFIIIVIGLMALSDSHFDKFLTSLLSSRGISSLTSILNTLSSDTDFRRLSNEHKILWFKCGRRLLISIQQIMYRQRQQSTVILVLQGDLLYSMVHSTAMIEFELGISYKDTHGPPMSDMYCMILRWITTFMTCRDVLNSFMRSFRRIESRSEVYASFQKAHCPPYAVANLGAVWKELVETAGVVKAIRDRYKTEYEMGFRHICVNPKVN